MLRNSEISKKKAAEILENPAKANKISENVFERRKYNPNSKYGKSVRKRASCSISKLHSPEIQGDAFGRQIHFKNRISLSPRVQNLWSDGVKFEWSGAE